MTGAPGAALHAEFLASYPYITKLAMLPEILTLTVLIFSYIQDIDGPIAYGACQGLKVRETAHH